jgi:hypothetical protein
MTNQDVFADMREVDADLQVQETILWSRAVLPSRLVEASASKDIEVAEQLRIEAMYQFAEFFYLLRAREIDSAEAIGNLADIHNAHISALTQDKAKMRRLGLNAERLLKAIFTSDTMPRLIETWRERPGCIDQSNLARFLVTVMSAETCRKLALACEKAAFVERIKSPFGAVLLSSTGGLEQIFGKVLRDQRLRLAAINTGNGGSK